MLGNGKPLPCSGLKNSIQRQLTSSVRDQQSLCLIEKRSLAGEDEAVVRRRRGVAVNWRATMVAVVVVKCRRRRGETMKWS